ncbi:MAG: AraC family transcriptional regulator [Planctomycetota bacterium]
MPTTWTRRLPLSDPPRLREAGRAQHGRTRTERYRMPTLWCLHLYDYDADLDVDGHAIAIRPGLATLVPPGARTVYRYRKPVNEHFYAHFGITTVHSNEARANTPSVPDAIPLGLEADAIRRQFERIVATRSTHPRHADALFWGLLWDLATRPWEATKSSPSPSTAPLGPTRSVADAVAYIDTHLHRPLRVADLARRVGLSHNHLTRQFRAHFDQTVAGFIRRRRIDRAKHLLLETDRPVAAVASEVGLPDLQQFNKTFRRETGRAPTRWRQTPS